MLSIVILFHLIDQGKVSYLYHLQKLLFNLQDALPSDNVSSFDNNGLLAIIVAVAIAIAIDIATSADEVPYEYYYCF